MGVVLYSFTFCIQSCVILVPGKYLFIAIKLVEASPVKSKAEENVIWIWSLDYKGVGNTRLKFKGLIVCTITWDIDIVVNVLAVIPLKLIVQVSKVPWLFSAVIFIKLFYVFVDGGILIVTENEDT